MVYRQYGSPDGFELQEMATPIPADDEVLVRVHASSINAWDWDLLRGRPYANRVTGGLRAPNRPILGGDVAGRVEAVGKNARDFAPGDEVFGDASGSGWGAYAEYVCIRQQALARKPETISFDQAAALPQAAMLAYQAMRKAMPKAGQRVLVVGAGGGAGSFAVQLAKSHGASVTAVDRGDKLEMLRSIGADGVVDYTRENALERVEPYDLIVDMVMQHSLFAYERALAANGRLVVVGGATGRILQTAALGPVLSRVKNKHLGLLLYKVSRADLETVGRLVEAGELAPVIDRTWPLTALPEAFRYFAAGNARGKVVITVSGENGGTG